jgi:hypothetical protein
MLDPLNVIIDISHHKFVAVPTLGVFAIDDSISERTLGARSAVGRFAAIVEILAGEDYEVRVTFAGTAADAQRALDTWTLDQFSFTVRPFNPTPRRLGEQVHESRARHCATRFSNSRSGSTRSHSMTSSASDSKLSDILTPSAFAVFKLITNWNLTVSITGRSAGLTPLSTRPV